MKTSILEIEGRTGRQRGADRPTPAPDASSPSTAIALRPGASPIALTGAYSGPGGLLRRIVQRGESAARGFWRARRASVAIEAALSMGTPIVAFAVLMEVVGAIYADDYMDRAARAAARAIAFEVNNQSDPAVLPDIACDAIKQELHLDSMFDCGQSWNLTIETALTAQDLLSGQPPANPTGEMVRVTIGWHRTPLSFDAAIHNNQQQGIPNEVAVAVARAEPVVTGP